MSARGRARRSAGGETRRPSSAGRDEASVRAARSVRDTPPWNERGPSDPEPTRRAGVVGEDARGDAPVLERDGHGVRACTTRSLEFDRDSPRVARACVAPPLDRKRSKARLRRQKSFGARNPILFQILFRNHRPESQIGKTSQAFSSQKPKMLFFFFSRVAERLHEEERYSKNNALQRERPTFKKTYRLSSRVSSRPPVPPRGSPPGPRALGARFAPHTGRRGKPSPGSFDGRRAAARGHPSRPLRRRRGAAAASGDARRGASARLARAHGVPLRNERVEVPPRIAWDSETPMGASARTNPERTTNDATSVPTNDRPPSSDASRRNSAETASPAAARAAAVPSAPPAAISVRILCSWCSKSRSRSARSRSRSSRRASSRADSRSTSRRSSAICSFSILTSRASRRDATIRQAPGRLPKAKKVLRTNRGESRGTSTARGTSPGSRAHSRTRARAGRRRGRRLVARRVDARWFDFFASARQPRASAAVAAGGQCARVVVRGELAGKRRGLLGFERLGFEALGFGCASGGASASSSPLGSSAADPPPRRRLSSSA